MSGDNLEAIQITEAAVVKMIALAGRAPDGAEVVSVRHDPAHRAFDLILRHERFREVAEGCAVPFTFEGVVYADTIGDGIAREAEEWHAAAARHAITIASMRGDAARIAKDRNDVQAEAKHLRAALEAAKRIVQGYESDARAVQDKIPGYCQGSVYLDAVAAIDRALRGEA